VKISNLQNVFKKNSWLAIFFFASMSVILFAGCAPQFLAVIGTPTKSEQQDTAEYDLSKNKTQKILVFVDQPTYLSDYPNLRFYLSDVINRILRDKAKVKPELLINYQALADLRMKTPDFSILTPPQIGQKLGADLVLAVTIIDCKVSELSGGVYYSGSLDAHAALYSVSSSEKLWPAAEQSRLVQVGFESERRGRDAAVIRLAAAAAHCVTRYLYNCPKINFKISDERTASGW